MMQANPNTANPAATPIGRLVLDISDVCHRGGVGEWIKNVDQIDNKLKNKKNLKKERMRKGTGQKNPPPLQSMT